MPCGWGRSRSTPSSTCCCAGSSGGRHGWIWRTIRTCLWRRWRPPPPPIIWLCWVRVDMDTPQVLLDHHLKTLRLPTFLREYDKVAQQCAAESVDFPRYLLRLTELELLDRERRATERRIRQAKFDVVKSLDSFDFLAIASLNKALVLDLARCEFIERKENVLALGNSGTGKTHIALALGRVVRESAWTISPRVAKVLATLAGPDCSLNDAVNAALDVLHEIWADPV